jgi:hypothetical protein
MMIDTDDWFKPIPLSLMTEGPLGSSLNRMPDESFPNEGLGDEDD